MQRGRLAACAILLTVLAAAQAAAESVLRIGPEEIEDLVARDHGDRLLVIHYSSDDGSCSFCVDSNDAVRQVAGAVGDRYVFARVSVNPWRAYFEDGNPAGAFQ